MPFQFEKVLERCTFPESSTAVTCAVSGGADSSALLILAVAAGLDVTAVHVDHGIRSGGSHEAAAVRNLADRFGARFRAVEVQVGSGSNLEERARKARFAALGPDVMTGHTADDQAETLLINLLRGAGLQGLAAMEPGWRHPILALRRSETEEVCRKAGVTPILDPSNNDPAFVRNRVRHELLPLMAEISDRDVAPLLNRTAAVARQANDAVIELASDLVPDGLPLPTRELQDVPRGLRAAALRQWIKAQTGFMPSQRDLDLVDEVVFHRAKAAEITGGWRIGRTGGSLSLRTAKSAG